MTTTGISNADPHSGDLPSAALQPVDSPTFQAVGDTFGGEGEQSATAGGGGGGKGGITGQDLKELSTSFKEMFEDIKALAVEIRVTVEESKNSETAYNIEETFREASDTYKTVKQELENKEK